MQLLNPEQRATLQPWFLPERPGPLIGSHIIQTGNGACFVDRWPDPQAVLVETAGNSTLLGAAHALTPAAIAPHIRGFVEASADFAPLLTAAFGQVGVWQRVIATRQAAPDPAVASAPGAASVRRLQPADAYHLWGLGPDVAWISKTWGGPHGLAASGCAWAAFVDGQLASVACTFFLGTTYEEIGVVTVPPLRGLGLSTACANALCRDISARGHQPCWTTSPDNIASRRVAERLGFAPHRYDKLLVVGSAIPEPATRPADA